MEERFQLCEFKIISKTMLSLFKILLNTLFLRNFYPLLKKSPTCKFTAKFLVSDFCRSIFATVFFLSADIFFLPFLFNCRLFCAGFFLLSDVLSFGCVVVDIFLNTYVKKIQTFIQKIVKNLKNKKLHTFRYVNGHILTLKTLM